MKKESADEQQRQQLQRPTVSDDGRFDPLCRAILAAVRQHEEEIKKQK